MLAMSLLASAVYALIDLLSGPVKGATVATFPQTPQLAPQLADIVFGLAPVWLVSYLLRRDGEDRATIGIAGRPSGQAWLSGLLLFAVVGVGGLAIYRAAVAMGINRMVVPIPPAGLWWTIPVILLGALQAALLEEVVVLGYLVTRLRQLSWSPIAAVAIAAVLRGSYHLYQGCGGFVGNVILGLIFGYLYVRRGRLWPMVIAHFLLDAASGLGYLALHGHVSWL